MTKLLYHNKPAPMGKSGKTRLLWQTENGKNTFVVFGDKESLYAVFDILHTNSKVNHCILYIDNKPTDGFGSFQL